MQLSTLRRGPASLSFVSGPISVHFPVDVVFQLSVELAA